MGLSVDVYAHGDRTTILASATADISASSPQCTPSAGGGRSCTISLTVPVGNDDFVFASYDATPVAGSFAGAHQLGYGLDTVAIVYGTPAAISVTLSSVLASLVLSVTPSTLHQIIPSTATLSVVALDADGDVIISSGFVDASGNPITLSFASSPSGIVTLSPATLSAPAPSGVQVAGESGLLTTAGTFPVTITASPSSSSVANASTQLTLVYPNFTSIFDTNLSTNNPYHGGMVFDSSNGVYYSTPSNYGGLSYYSGSGSSVGSYAATAAEPIRGGIAANGNAAAYLIAGDVEEVFGAGPTVMAGPNSVAAPVPNGSAMVYDSTRQTLDYTSGSSLVLYGALGGSPQAVSLGVIGHGGIAIDSLDNVWVTDHLDLQVLKWNGSTLTENPLSGPPFDVVANANGIFVSVQGTNPAIVELNESGSVVQTIALTSGVIPWYMCADPAQSGVIWFDAAVYGQIGIGRLDTNVSPPSLSMASDVNGPFGAFPGAIGVAPNGSIYMVFDGTGTLVQVQR